MTSLVASLVLAIAFAPPQADGVSLKWKMNVGDTFYAQSVVGLEQTVTAAGKDVEQKQDQTAVSRYKVTKADKDGYTLEQTILQSIIETNILPGGAGDLSKKLRGATFTITLDDQLKVKKFEGIDDLIQKLGANDPKVKPLLAATLNEDAMKKSVQDLFYCGPDKIVKVGDTWKREDTLPLGPLGDMTLAMEYKYAGSKAGTEDIVLSGKATYAAPKKDAGGALPFKVVNADLKTEKMAGNLSFDSKAGRLKESTMEMKMSGTLTLAINGMEVAMDLKQKIVGKTTILDKNPVVD
ncbi:DUF6263 family protein [Limnoglobus roseus]|uniref:TIGR03067 domain-containing protein n=1 Tax=Limnoglobus roseus TaxID=2598579 RepID=A0A5C1AC44_9BACT|nr:DUF6263 family protein [Limnoglobus roseus]QEL15753.1 hypothetical protein PX52LOC_02688 [Limnoglobus roseus]